MIKTIFYLRFIKQPSTKKISSTSNNSIKHKLILNMISKSKIKSNQNMIFIIFDSNRDIKKEKIYISDLKINNNKKKKVIK